MSRSGSTNPALFSVVFAAAGVIVMLAAASVTQVLAIGLAGLALAGGLAVVARGLRRRRHHRDETCRVVIEPRDQPLRVLRAVSTAFPDSDVTRIVEVRRVVDQVPVRWELELHEDGLALFGVVAMPDGSHVVLACPRCGYELTNVETHGCPECGWHRARVLAPE